MPLNLEFAKLITLNRNQCGVSDTSNYPLTLRVIDEAFKHVSAGGKVQSSSGYDIRPYTADLLTALPFELVPGTYSGTAGSFEMHVKVPLVTVASDAQIALCCGDAALTSDGTDLANTWDANFVDVYHIPNGSTVSGATSVSGGHAGTNVGMTADAGQINGGATGNATDQYIDCGSPSWANSALTISGWMKWNWSTPDYPVAMGHGWGPTAGFALFGQVGGTFADWVAGDILCGGDGYTAGRAPRAVAAPPGGFTDGSWHLFSCVLSASIAQIYCDGVALSMRVSTVGAVPSITTQPYGVGKANTGGNVAVGSIDEVRLSKVVRTASWHTLDYHSQRKPTTALADFLTWGPLTSLRLTSGLQEPTVGSSRF